MKRRGLGERGKRNRSWIRVALLAGIVVLMLWSSPTAARPGLLPIPLTAPVTLSPHAAITNVTLLLENDNAKGAVFGGLATGASGFGVVGFASDTSSANFGVAGATNSSTGSGVFGLAFAPNGACTMALTLSLGSTCFGVVGQSLAGGPTSTAGVLGLTAANSFFSSSPFSPTAFGVFGYATASSGFTIGTGGQSDSPVGTGVFGNATATTCTGVPVSIGQACIGVVGQSLATSGTAAGVAGIADSDKGTGVFGHALATSGPTTGTDGQSDSTNGTGVFGSAIATSGVNFGVQGQTNSPNGTGVFGNATASSCPAITPANFVNYGETCVGVFGLAPSNGNGVAGVSGGGSGVIGVTFSPGGFGVAGVAAGMGGGIAGYFDATNGGIAADFLGPVIITGNLTETGNLTVNGNSLVTGTKSALVDTASYGKRQLYSVESPESWFEDFGSARLTNGRAVVRLDPVFAQTVNTEEEYHIFLTPKGECKGLYVANQRATSFEVRELQNGKSSIAFDYRIVAKRKGYERARLPEPAK